MGIWSHRKQTDFISRKGLYVKVLWNFKETPKKSNWFWKEKSVTVIKRQTEIATRCKSMLCFWKTILKKLSKSINYQKVRDHCYYNGKDRSTGHTQWTHLPQFVIYSTSKFHVESSPKLHRFWKTNLPRNYDIDSMRKFRRGFGFQNRQHIDEFSPWIFLCRFDVKLT